MRCGCEADEELHHHDRGRVFVCRGATCQRCRDHEDAVWASPIEASQRSRAAYTNLRRRSATRWPRANPNHR